MLHIKLDVRLKRLKIWKRLLVVSEIGRVIPDVELGRDWLPCQDIIAEAPVLGRVTGGQGVSETAFDRAQPDNDILSRAQRFWRLPRVLIRQRIDPNIGKIRLNVFGDGVYKAD